jgi:hypothetical protein
MDPPVRSRAVGRLPLGLLLAVSLAISLASGQVEDVGEAIDEFCETRESKVCAVCEYREANNFSSNPCEVGRDRVHALAWLSARMRRACMTNTHTHTHTHTQHACVTCTHTHTHIHGNFTHTHAPPHLPTSPCVPAQFEDEYINRKRFDVCMIPWNLPDIAGSRVCGGAPASMSASDHLGVEVLHLIDRSGSTSTGIVGHLIVWRSLANVVYITADMECQVGRLLFILFYLYE